MTDEAIRAHAARQHGLVTRTQLLELGLSPKAVKHLRASRLFQQIHRGVYRVGPLVSPYEREMAAVLACGPDAVVSHRSAAGLWRLLLPRGASALVEITLRSPHRRRRPGVRAYTAPGMPAEEVTTVDGIPVTSPSRTVLDLANVITGRRLEQVLAVADREGLAKPEQMEELVRRHRRRAGAAALRAQLTRTTDPIFTRSDLEERVLALVDRYELPRPEFNVDLLHFEVDLLWRRERLVVELDGWRTHGTRVRFVGDRKRDRRLSIAGYRVIRFTWSEVAHTPGDVASELRTLLGLGTP